MHIIGIDIGGMSIKGGLVTEEGKILDTFTVVVNYHDDPKKSVGELSDAVNEFMKKHSDIKDIAGIGIGVPGVVNTEKGTVDYSANLYWENVPLKDWIIEQCKLPVKITNDANAAALGEAKFGAGKNYHDVIMITLGTGVGGGVVINNKLFEGFQGKGAELGHMVIVLDGIKCSCERRGCLERYASATALMNQTKEMMLAHHESLMWELCDGDINKVNGKVPFDAEAQGDPAGTEVVNNYVKYLGEGILNFCNIFRPQAIVLSGGVAKQGKNLTDRLTDYCRKQYFGYKNTPEVEILTAELGYESGIIGGASLFL